MTTLGTSYRECTYCVMDTSDPDIAFDPEGRCNHCRSFDEVAKTQWLPNEEGARRLDLMLDLIKERGRGTEFDCVLGLSGGIDSSYLALKAHEWGLRPLVVHIDAGWNSELAVQNIERIVKYTGYDLHTDVVNWDDMRRLQLSFLRAGVANQDVPQDHAFFAGLYNFAVKNDVRYVLNGGNLATEGIFPKSWQGPAMDAINLEDIHNCFGDGPLENYPTIGFYRYYLWYPVVRRMTPLRPLNLIPYSKEIATVELSETLGWRAYARKHGESIFTKFFQNYYLPERFGLDKRRPHFSSLVAAGSMTREEAKRQLGEPLYDLVELKRDTEYLCRKLGLTPAEFGELMRAPRRDFREFRTWDRRHQLLSKARSAVGRVTGRHVSFYSN